MPVKTAYVDRAGTTMRHRQEAAGIRIIAEIGKLPGGSPLNKQAIKAPIACSHEKETMPARANPAKPL
jgi:hypothetical protein